MIESVELAFKYTESEYIKAERQYLFASRAISKTSIVVIVLYLPFSLWYFLHFRSVFGAIFLGVALIAAFILCMLYFFLPGYKFRQTSKHQEEYQMTFSEDGILFITPTINSQLKWDIYSAFWESDDFYFLVQGTKMYSLIPKRTMPGPAVRRDFEDIVLSKLTNPKRVL